VFASPLALHEATAVLAALAVALVPVADPLAAVSVARREADLASVSLSLLVSAADAPKQSQGGDKILPWSD